MQDFIGQAKKNEVILLKIGKCQFCGADYKKGIFDCMDNYNIGTEIIDYNKSENLIYKFLSVDAYALQHSEIHGRWSNHFHLLRLHLILKKKQSWDYKKSPLLSKFLNEYKIKKPNEFLDPPKPINRGNLTSKDVFEVKTPNECILFINNWAFEVYESWSLHHCLINEIAISFLDSQNYRSK